MKPIGRGAARRGTFTCPTPPAGPLAIPPLRLARCCDADMASKHEKLRGWGSRTVLRKELTDHAEAGRSTQSSTGPFVILTPATVRARAGYGLPSLSCVHT